MAVGPLRLVKFTADWCGPCKKQQPLLDELEQEFGDRIEFQREDIDVHPELAAIYSIQSVPTLLVLDQEGDVIASLSHVGFNKVKLRLALVDLLAKESEL